MKRILVIEDEPQMRLGLRDNLELEGYEVETAADGDEGLQKAASFTPDLVILDVMLPKKNGFDVCRDLRARSISTPIVMLTARSAETDKVLGLELGGGPQGTGLGLAIVDHTMRGHGGFVRVDSEPDQGSTFSLHFPIPSDNAFQGAFAESIR